MESNYYLRSFGFHFDGITDAGRDEVEFSIQSRFQGIHPKGVDYNIQPYGYPNPGWQVNGLTALGARACASVCRGFDFRPTTIKVTARIPQEILSYALVVDVLKDWHIKNKPQTAHHEHKQPTGEMMIVWGKQYARQNIIVETEGTGLLITYKIYDRVMEAWSLLDYFQTDIEYNEACKRLFDACTNTFLAFDYFGLGHEFTGLLKAGKVADIQQDWWGYLTGVASKIRAQAKKEHSQFLAVESVKFIENQIAKGIEREAKELNEKAVRDRQFVEGVV